MVADPVPDTVAQLTYSLVLDAGTGIYVYVRPASGSVGDVSAEMADTDAALPVKALPDGRYRIEVRDIPAHELGAMRGIRITVGGSVLEVSVSPLSYVYDVMRSTPGGTEGAMGPGCGGLAPQILEGDAGLQGQHLTLGVGPR